MPNFPEGLKTEFLFDADIDLAPAEAFGATARGTRSVHIVTGGLVDGPKLRGGLLPGGGDWLMTYADGVSELDVRATICTEDDALILLSYRGVLDVAPDVVRRAMSEHVEPSEYYFRTTPRFETGAEKYAWLNKLVCVGVGWFGRQKVAYRVFGIR